MTKSRIFLSLLLACIAGVGLRSCIVIPSWFMEMEVLVAACSIAIGVARVQYKSIVYGFLIVALLGGILRFQSAIVSQPDLSALYGLHVVADGIVDADPSQTPHSQQIIVRIEKINSSQLGTPILTVITAQQYPQYALGDVLTSTGVIKQPTNFSDFDYVSYLAGKNIFSEMAFPKIEKENSAPSGVIATLAAIKHVFENKIADALPEPHAGLMKGLLFGEKQSISQNFNNDLRATGTTHIIALSGYNITIVAEFFLNILLWVSAPFSISFWVASLGIILFVVMTGASASAVRAGIMGVLVLVARREGRRYSMINALVFAAAVMIFYNPHVLLSDVGFQLSFLATAGLIFLAPYIEQRLEKFFSRDSHIKKTLSETLAAQLAVLPILIYTFGQLSLVSPLTNILVLMAVPYAMTAGFVTGMLGFVWEPVSRIFGWVAWIFSSYIIGVIEVFAKIPGASVQLGSWSIAPILILYCIVIFYVWQKQKEKSDNA